MLRVLAFTAVWSLVACVTTPERPVTTATSPALCSHAVPGASCVRCHPELAASFKSRGDWCPEHGLPETQCLECHPGMKFAELPVLPESADLRFLSTMGEDVPALEPHAVRGKITVFDFYAAWCVACRDIDLHLYDLLVKRDDLALRKLNVMSWETPVSQRYLSKVPELPYLVVMDANGALVGTVSGFDVDALDALLAKAAR